MQDVHIIRTNFQKEFIFGAVCHINWRHQRPKKTTLNLRFQQIPL